MEETPICFNISLNGTADNFGAKIISILATGLQQTCFSVLAQIHEKNRLYWSYSREEYPTTIVVACNKKGWINIDIIKFGVDRFFCASAGEWIYQKSLLIMDLMTSHENMTVRTRPNSSAKMFQ
ncbi:LOW QUALITY PROTEIN: hypothetical protein HZS_2537 [Henneguya salminicola]|nr:LOW QUALITY PROTEIN: hypothetical protein HZS_2537 [Henneguya salminicola]